MNLFIDTHLNDIVIILYKNGKIVKQKCVKNEKENSKLIMPTIEELVNKDELESVVVVNGPGSFTGVRLGVTIAKTLAYTLNLKIYTVTSLECLAISTFDDNKIVAFKDPNGYYIGIFNDNLKLIGNYEYLSNSDFLEYKEKYKVITDIERDYEKIIAFALSRKPLNPHEVNPIYVKKLDVEK